MKYIFIVNGRADKSHILPDLKSQIEKVNIDYSIYVTTGVGDGTRYVRMYCDFHPKDVVCFVACGGSGTSNEVASGIIGRDGKSMAIMAYGTTNDLLKYYPARNFKSLEALLKSTDVHNIDVIKCNDDYSINVINFGFDAMVAHYGNMLIEQGMSGGYRKALTRAIILNRHNRFKVVVDGETITKGRSLMCNVANAQYCGGQFKCAPRAVVDDGLLEVCLIKNISLLTFLRILPVYEAGKHLDKDNKLCSKIMVYRRARKIELESKDLLYLSLDGETIASDHFNIEVLDKALPLHLPCKY